MEGERQVQRSGGREVRAQETLDLADEVPSRLARWVGSSGGE